MNRILILGWGVTHLAPGSAPHGNYGDTLPFACVLRSRHHARMARIGRIVVPGFSHHVTQRGSRRQPVFFEPPDYALYRDLLAERCRKASVEVWRIA
jgi:hypothetical protein